VKVQGSARAGRSVALAPGGLTVAVGCNKGTLVWLDAVNGQERGRLERREQPNIDWLEYSRDGRSLAVRAGLIDAFVVDCERFRSIRSFALLISDHWNQCSAIALRPDGARLAVAFSERNSTTRISTFDIGS